MTWTRNVDDIQVVLLDQTIEMNVDEIQPWCRAPMTQQARLDVFDFQRLMQEWIGIKDRFAPQKDSLQRASTRASCAALLRIKAVWIHKSVLNLWTLVRPFQCTPCVGPSR